MDIEKVNLQFKKNDKGTLIIAYCDAYPQIQGKGQNETMATTDFWRSYNNNENNSAKVVSMRKKEDKNVTADNPKKKAA